MLSKIQRNYQFHRFGIVDLYRFVAFRNATDIDKKINRLKVIIVV